MFYILILGLRASPSALTSTFTRTKLKYQYDYANFYDLDQLLVLLRQWVNDIAVSVRLSVSLAPTLRVRPNLTL